MAQRRINSFHSNLFIVLMGDRQRKEMTGDVPSDLLGFCGSNMNDMLYIFGGCDSAGYSNQVRLRGRGKRSLTQVPE